MIISFFSNYLTHHQIPFCEEMSRLPDVQFTFISTMPMEEERSGGGWELDGRYPYELKAYADAESEREALRLAKVSDVVIIGSAPESYVQYRMAEGERKLTFRYSERIYKRGRWRVLSPRGAIQRIRTYFRYAKQPLYMLCASAYTAGDLAMLGSYLGKCFRWGYFPATEICDTQKLLREKEPATLLWTARMIDWKHPEAAVRVARRLKQDGYDFRLDMIGSGEQEETVRRLIDQYGLSDRVHLLGTMKPEQVRQQMKKHAIFLFTSDQNEGWGAVLNEAMNSGCAVVANDRIGAVPFLMQDGQNGLVYEKGREEELYQKVKFLLDHPEEAARLGGNAYHTVTEKWSAAVAAERLHKVCQSLMAGEMLFFPDGPCGKAPLM